MPFDQELQSLPHGPEFRFIDEMATLEPGSLRQRDLQDHWRGTVSQRPFPGPADVARRPHDRGHRPTWRRDRSIGSGQDTLDDLRLTSVKNAKILGTAAPGGVLTVQASVEGRLGTLIQIKGSVSHGETKIAEAIVMLSGT